MLREKLGPSNPVVTAELDATIVGRFFETGEVYRRTNAIEKHARVSLNEINAGLTAHCWSICHPLSRYRHRGRPKSSRSHQFDSLHESELRVSRIAPIYVRNRITNPGQRYPRLLARPDPLILFADIRFARSWLFVAAATREHDLVSRLVTTRSFQVGNRRVTNVETYRKRVYQRKCAYDAPETRLDTWELKRIKRPDDANRHYGSLRYRKNDEETCSPKLLKKDPNSFNDSLLDIWETLQKYPGRNYPNRLRWILRRLRQSICKGCIPYEWLVWHLWQTGKNIVSLHRNSLQSCLCNAYMRKDLRKLTKRLTKHEREFLQKSGWRYRNIVQVNELSVGLQKSEFLTHPTALSPFVLVIAFESFLYFEIIYAKLKYNKHPGEMSTTSFYIAAPPERTILRASIRLRSISLVHNERSSPSAATIWRYTQAGSGFLSLSEDRGARQRTGDETARCRYWKHRRMSNKTWNGNDDG